MIDFAMQSRLAALEANVEILAATCRYLQTLVNLQGKSAIEAFEATRLELRAGDRKLREIQELMGAVDDDDDDDDGF